MALFAPVANSLFASFSYRALLLILVGLLATTVLAACGSDPEPTAVPPPVAAAVDTQPAAAIEQPAQEASPAAIPSGSAPSIEQAREQAREPANTPASTLAPIAAMGPSTARQPREAPTVSLGVEATGSGESGRGEAGTGDSPGTASGALTLGDLGPDTTWGEVFSNFSEEEQACVRNELGEERLDRMLGQPFSAEGLDGTPATIIDCLSEDTGRWMLVAVLSAQFGGLSEAQEICLYELVGNFSLSDLVKGMAPEPDPEYGLMMMSFGLGLIGCIPELAQSMGGPPGDIATGEDTFAQDPSYLWSFTTGGWVIPAPAVVDGVVYAGSDDHSLYALDAETGSLQWSHATGDVIRSTPTVGGRRGVRRFQRQPPVCPGGCYRRGAVEL